MLTLSLSLSLSLKPFCSFVACCYCCVFLFVDPHCPPSPVNQNLASKIPHSLSLLHSVMLLCMKFGARQGITRILFRNLTGGVWNQPLDYWGYPKNHWILSVDGGVLRASASSPLIDNEHTHVQCENKSVCGGGEQNGIYACITTQFAFQAPRY